MSAVGYTSNNLVHDALYDFLGSWVGDAHLETTNVGEYEYVGTILPGDLTKLSSGIYRGEYQRVITYRQFGHFKTIFGNTKSYTRVWNELQVGTAWVRQTNFADGFRTERISPITRGYFMYGPTN